VSLGGGVGWYGLVFVALFVTALLLQRLTPAT
jgi:hypothetical protein